jgi:hypothetical protein
MASLSFIALLAVYSLHWEAGWVEGLAREQRAAKDGERESSAKCVVLVGKREREAGRVGWHPEASIRRPLKGEHAVVSR